MKLKKALSGILCMAMICLLLPVMPQSGEAATVGSIEPVKVGDSQIVVNLNGAKEGDNFEVRVNGVKVNSGDLYSEDGAYKQMYFGLGPGYKAKAGD